MDPADSLVSFEVVSLYTKIHIQEAIDVINRITHTHTTKLVSLCLTSTFFNLQGDFYEEYCGVAMGSPIYPTIANLFMKDFVTKDLASTQFHPKKWKMFVDDTCVIFSHGH